MLCSTPLAGVSLPASYMGWDRELCTPSYTTCSDWPDQVRVRVRARFGPALTLT